MLRHFTSATKSVQILSRKKQIFDLTRYFSATTPPTPEAPKPPNALTKDIAFGIQNATAMFINHGVGHQKLAEIGKESGDVETLVSRWQRMMEAFLGTQVHVLAGLGYAPNEGGLRKFYEHWRISMHAKVREKTALSLSFSFNQRQNFLLRLFEKSS